MNVQVSMKIFKAMVLIAMCLLIVSFAVRPNNLIRNGGFETTSGQRPAHWLIDVPPHTNSAETEVDQNESHSGRRSFRISRTWIYPRKGIKLETEEPFAIDPQKKYILSFWYKTKGISEYPLAFSAKFKVACANTPTVEYGKQVYNSSSWQQYHILLDNIPHDGKNVSVSFNSMVNTKGSIWLDDIAFHEASAGDVQRFEKWRRQSVPETVGKTQSRTFKATGFFRVEKADDRWWLINPEGTPTWAIAIAGSKGPAPGPENPVSQTGWFKNEFGTTHRAVNEKLYSIFTEDCGFNAFAGWSAPEHALITQTRYESGEPYMPMTRVLGLASASADAGVFARDRNGNLLNRPGHEVPDPFNPQWKRMARAKAAEIISLYRDKPWFLGWFVDNEMSFDELFRYVWAEYSSKAFIKSLQQKYEAIDDVNRAWSSSFKEYRYATFDEILEDKPEPKEWDDPLWEDFAAFERMMIDEYITFTYNLVKELDPNHLVISNRINLGPMPELHRTIDLWGKYDIVCMNIYPDNNKIGFNPGELAIMKKFHEGTSRPVIIGEWSIPSIDSDLYAFGKDSLNRPLDWSWPQVLRTQKERGEAYDMCIRQLASFDFMVGAGWFITFDVDTKERRANRGIINKNFELYRDLTDAMKRSNNAIKEEMGLSW